MAPDSKKDDAQVVVFDELKDKAEYNTIFDSLVSGQADDEVLVGYIAYVFYKIAKREWVEDFYGRNARHPNDAEMRSYISSWTPSVMDSVRSEANQVLSQYASYVVEKAAPKIREQVLIHRSFVREAFVAFCGAFIYTLVLIVVAVVLHFSGIDIVEVSKHLAPEPAHITSRPSTDTTQEH